MSNTIFTKTDSSTVTVATGSIITQADYPSGWAVTDIKSVNIGTVVTDISDNTFFNASNMESVFIPNSVTTIGLSAFQLSGLISVNIPASVSSVGTYAFSDTTTLSDITLNSNVNSLAFYQNPAYGEPMTTIKFDYAGPIQEGFCNGRTNLTSVTILQVTSIEDGVFRSTTSLTSITIPSSVTSIGNYAFYQSHLGGITIPASVTSIGGYAFLRCASLTGVVFESGSQLQTIGSNSFEYSGLTTVYMSSNTLNHLNSIFAPPTLFFGLNPLFFGANNVTIFSTDPSPPPIPAPISNRPGPIQYCTSRFARCTLTKKTSFSSGNVTIQGTTNARRQSLIVNQSTYRQGAKLLFSNQVLNAYGRKAGGPGGFGASPRNQF